LDTAIEESKRNLSNSAIQVSAVRDRMIELARAVHNKTISTADELAASILSDNKVSILSDDRETGPNLGVSDADALKTLIGRSDSDVVADLVKNDKIAFVIRTPWAGMPGTGSDENSILASEKPTRNSLKISQHWDRMAIELLVPT
jgi:hypothetical protein